MLETDEDRFLKELASGVEQCEDFAHKLAENLVAQSRGERFPHPGVSVELLAQEIGAVKTRAERSEREVIWSVNGFYRLHDCVLLPLLLLEKRCSIYEQERSLLMLGTLDDAAKIHLRDPQLLVHALFVRQPRSHSMKRAGKNSNPAAAGKGRRVELMFVQGAVSSFAADRASLAIGVTQLEQPGRGKPPALSVEHTEPEWSEDGCRVRFQIGFSEGTQVMPSAVTVAVAGAVSWPRGKQPEQRQGGGEEGGEATHVSSVTVAACNALPMVVCTNENQWELAESRLVRRQAFENSARAPWPLLANWLREFFMRATRQDLLESALSTLAELAALPPLLRGLSERELARMHAVWFEGAPVVLETQFAAFFEWFGPACHHLRHTSMTRLLFVRGLIFGFVDRPECERLLAGKPDGYFLFYFHESSKLGDLCISLVHDGQVLHHKVDAKKLRPPFGSLADYVRNKQELRMLVVPFVMHENGTRREQVCALEKNAALEEFYAPIK